MFEKELDLERWPDAKVRVRMFNSIQVTDIGRAINTKPGLGLPLSGVDLDRYFRAAVVSFENAPQLNKETVSGGPDSNCDYVLPQFMFEVIMGAMSYSQVTEEEAKNS